MSLSEKNLSERTLDVYIKQYYVLKEQQRLLDKQLKLLKRIISQEIEQGKQHSGRYHVTLQQRLRVTYDPAELEQLIYDKGLWEECTRSQVDESLVEQAFIEGKITDTDLRAIRKSTVNLALTVDEVRNVQTDDDSNRGQ